MDTLSRNIGLTVPLFVLVLVGYCLARWGTWPQERWKGLSGFVFAVALPALLFRQMTDISDLGSVEPELLLAFFGGCLVVFVAGRIVARRILGCDGSEQILFALGGVLSNNVLLGIPLAEATLGDRALPSVAMVLVFNSLVLWTLATVSIEWTRTRSVSAAGLRAMALSLAKNPVVMSILAGTAVGLLRIPVPTVVNQPLGMLATAATPLALVALGATLTGYQVRSQWRFTAGICVLKLVVQPLAVWSLAVTLGLPTLEVQVVTLLASISVGANVYLMATRFQVMEGPIAASLLVSTGLSSLTTPIVLTLLHA